MFNFSSLFANQIADLSRAVEHAAQPAPAPAADPNKKPKGGARDGAGRKMRSDQAASRKRVISALREHQPAGPQLISEVTGMCKSVVRNHLLAMVASGQARRLEDCAHRYAPYVLARRP